MGKMGERIVQESKSSVFADEIQRTSRFICTLGIGISMKISIFDVIYQHEEPYDGRLSRTVPWEDRSEILLSDPISNYLKNETDNKMQ